MILDPNQALTDFRTAAASGDANGAVDAMWALDQWLTQGGFPPDEWNKERR